MADIYRLHLSVSGACLHPGVAYHTKIDFKNPGQSEWKRRNVSFSISGDVYLMDVPKIEEGATVRFVMDVIRVCARNAVVASEEFIYKKDSVYYASYNFKCKDFSNHKSSCSPPMIAYEVNFIGIISSAVYSGEASALFLKVTGGYAYNAKIQYRENDTSTWKTTKHIVNVTVGIPEIVNICDVNGINSGNQFRFVMDIVAGNENVIADQYFTYNKDIRTIARYDCQGVPKNPKIIYKGIEVFSPVDFIYDSEKEDEKLEKLAEEIALEKAKIIVNEKGIEDENAKKEAIEKAKEEVKEAAIELAQKEKNRNFSIYSKDPAGMSVGSYARIENHNLADVMKFKNNGWIASIFAEDKNKRNRITTYASGPKDKGAGHIWFINSDYNCYEEDVILHGERPKEQTTNCGSKDSKIIYISWNDKFFGGDKSLLTYLTEKGIGIDNLFEHIPGFSSEEKKTTEGKNRIFYFAKVDCMQRKFGYCDLYDEVFNFATTMDKEKFEFTSGGKRYIFWTWKGNYLNLGAGAEMGFYEYKCTLPREKLTEKLIDKFFRLIAQMRGYNVPEYISLDLKPELKTIKHRVNEIITMILSKITDKNKSYEYDYYESDKPDEHGKEKTPMFKMSLALHGKNKLPDEIYTYEPDEKQWWITTFAPYLQGVNPKDLAPTFKVWFDEKYKDLFYDFVKACQQNPEWKDKWLWREDELYLEHTFQ